MWVGAAMVGVLGLVLFSWVALTAFMEPGKFGVPGRVALKMANLPGNVQKAWDEAWDNITGAEATRYLSVPRPRIDLSEFRPVTMPDGTPFSGLMVRGDLGRADRGWRLFGGAMEVDGTPGSAIALLDPDLVVRRVWAVNEDDVEVTGKSLDSRRVLHGLALLPDTGSVVFNFDFGSAVQRRDTCNRAEWMVTGEYHHSVMPTEDGKEIWLMRIGQFPTRHTPGDLTAPPNTGFVKVDARTGEILREFSLEEMMAANPELGLFELGRVDEEEAETNAAHVAGRWLADPMHFNDADPLPPSMAAAFPEFEAGDLLVSARNINTVLVVDPDTLKVKWHQTGGFLRQHDPDWQPDGTISVYDNGMGRGVSRIVSIDVKSHRISTSYDGEAQGFYTRVRGKHMRTGRGDLAVVSPQQGMAFELGADGDRVLEFISLKPGSDDKNFGLNEYQWLPENALNHRRPDMFRQLIPVTAIFALVPAMAQAYIGPGMGLGAVASLLGLVAVFFMVMVAFIWFPIKRRIAKRRAAADKAEA